MAAAMLLAGISGATLIPRLSFEQLTDASEVVVSGRVARSWAAWDPEHKYIWTHYELAVSSTLKGRASSKVEFAEPGGVLDGHMTSIDGTVSYVPGTDVVIFLSRMPNGFLRTTGWAQGKYSVNESGLLHASSVIGSDDAIRAGSGARETSLRTLEGMSVASLRQHVAEHLRASGIRRLQ